MCPCLGIGVGLIVPRTCACVEHCDAPSDFTFGPTFGLILGAGGRVGGGLASLGSANNIIANRQHGVSTFKLCFVGSCMVGERLPL